MPVSKANITMTMIIANVKPAVNGSISLNNATTRFTRGDGRPTAAIQRGKHSYFKNNSSVLWVIVDTTGTNADSVIITRALNLANEYGVQVTERRG